MSMTVEFIRSWDRYSVGQRITPYGVLRQFLIERNIAKPVVADTMVGAKPKRGRPPKSSVVMVQK